MGYFRLLPGGSAGLFHKSREMKRRNQTSKLLILALLHPLCIAVTGCHTTSNALTLPSPLDAAPRELSLVPQPPYVIETSDILLIDIIHLVPKPPYRIQPLDSLSIQANNVVPDEPIAGLYVITPEGTVILGPSYGSVHVKGLTLEEAQQAIFKHLRKKFLTATAYVALGQIRGGQQIRGEHLVLPDGTITLGVYGSVVVTGSTIAEARSRIEAHLSQFLDSPELSVDVYALNSKHYYIIAAGAGFGEQIQRFPSTGNDTVLDALSRINGLPAVASQKRIWVARPCPDPGAAYQILPVDYRAITRCGDPTTNYQLRPNDRLFIDDDKLIALDTYLARIISPIERILGVTLLGNATIRSFERGRGGSNGGTTGSVF
jgi:polysaccharide export outer membrane protein